MEAYTTVGTVCSAALFGGLVDLDVLNDQVTGVETLGISVGFRLEHQRVSKVAHQDRTRVVWRKSRLRAEAKKKGGRGISYILEQACVFEVSKESRP